MIIQYSFKLKFKLKLPTNILTYVSTRNITPRAHFIARARVHIVCIVCFGFVYFLLFMIQSLNAVLV